MGGFSLSKDTNPLQEELFPFKNKTDWWKKMSET